MIVRRMLLPLAVAVLAVGGCTATVDGQGSPASGPSSRSGPAPCASTTTQAPGCVPSPSPSPTGTGSVTGSVPVGSAVPSRWAGLLRSAPSTALGDPAVLNVCRTAQQVDLARYGLRPKAPDSASPASCTLSLTARGRPVASAVVAVEQDAPPATGTPRRTSVQGRRVDAYPYRSDGSCLRVMPVERGDGPGALSVRLSGALPGGATVACAVSDLLLAPFAAVAAGDETVPVLSSPTPSVLALDACKVADAAGLPSSPLARGRAAQDADWGTSCVWGDSTAVLAVSAGVLRDLSGSPDGDVTTVDGHRVHDTTDLRGTCRYTSGQPGGETLAIYWSRRGGVSPAECGAARQLLVRYLDVLGLQ